MFNGPGAKKYDFSHLNPFIVAGVILLICYLGSKNTYYDQFYNVSQLPENRNELSIIQGTNGSTIENKVFFNISLKYYFKITYENFRDSFSVVIDQHGFKSIHNSKYFFDYRIDDNKVLSGFALSAIFGNVTVSYKYLNELIYQTEAYIPSIALLFPGDTLLSLKEDHYHFSNVCINQNGRLVVHFRTPVEFAYNWVKFENGNSLQISNVEKNAQEDCTSRGIKCNEIKETSHLFSLPNNPDPYDLFISFFNPLSSIEFRHSDERILFISKSINSETSQLIKEMNPLIDNKIELLNFSGNNFFKELRIRKKVSHGFKMLTKRILKNSGASNLFDPNKLVIVTDESTRNLISEDKAKKISSVICKSMKDGCNHEFVEFNASADFVSKLNKAHFAILPKEKAHFMFPLNKKSVVFLLGESSSSDEWINKMANDLLVQLKYIQYENNKLNTSAFDI